MARFFDKILGKEAKGPKEAAGSIEENMDEKRKIEALQADMDKVKVELQVVNEMRKATSEQNAKIEEQIGELRGILSDKERELKEMQVNVAKSVELLGQIRPEKVIVELQRQNAKIEMVEARIKSYHKISEKIMTDFKSIRKEVAPFKGVSQLIKFSNKIKDDLELIEKTKNMVERHANEAEKILIRIESKYAEFERYKKAGEQMKQQFNEVLKELDGIKVNEMPQKKNVLGGLMTKHFGKSGKKEGTDIEEKK